MSLELLASYVGNRRAGRKGILASNRPAMMTFTPHCAQALITHIMRIGT
jgi:hypothetical protein